MRSKFGRGRKEEPRGGGEEARATVHFPEEAFDSKLPGHGQ